VVDIKVVTPIPEFYRDWGFLLQITHSSVFAICCTEAICVLDLLYWLQDQTNWTYKINYICSAPTVEINCVTYAAFQPKRNICLCPGWSFNFNTMLGDQPAITLNNRSHHILLWEIAQPKQLLQNNLKEYRLFICASTIKYKGQLVW